VAGPALGKVATGGGQGKSRRGGCGAGGAAQCAGCESRRAKREVAGTRASFEKARGRNTGCADSSSPEKPGRIRGAPSENPGDCRGTENACHTRQAGRSQQATFLDLWPVD